MNSEEEHKVPWYKSEAMSQIIVWSILIGIFVAISGIDMALEVLINFIPYVLFGGLFALGISKFIYGDFSEAKDMWILCAVGLFFLIELVPRLLPDIY